MEIGFSGLPENDIISMAKSGNEKAMTFIMEKYKSPPLRRAAAAGAWRECVLL